MVNPRHATDLALKKKRRRFKENPEGTLSVVMR
jgi:hypothetical protein